MANLASDGGNTARAKKKKEQEALAAALRAAAQAALPVANVGMQAAGKGNLDPKFPSEVPAGNIAGSPGEGRGGDKFTLPKWSDIKGRLGLVQEKQTAPRLAPELRFNGVSGRQMAGPTLAEVGQKSLAGALSRNYGEKGPYAQLELETMWDRQRKERRDSETAALKSMQDTYKAAGEKADGLKKQWEQAERQASALGFLSPGQAPLARQNRDALKSQWEAAQQERDSLASQIKGKKYALLSLEDDWDAGSRYRSTANGKRVTYSPLDGRPQETGFQDVLYDYVNGNPRAVELVDARDTITGNYTLGFDKNYLKQMTGDEVKTYNYLYAKDGKAAAEEYLKDITSGLTQKQRAQEEAGWAARARKEPVRASLFSVLESPAKGISYLGQMIDFVGDGKLDQNAGYNRYSYVNSAVRGQVSEIVEEKWGKPGSFLYQTGMSMGDFLLNTAITGGNQGLSLAIMGTGAAADATIAAKDRGLEDWQAFTLGTIAGAAEVVTEKVSLDTLLDKTSLGKNAVGYLLKNVLAEGSEEVGSDLINLTADLLISKDKSEWNMAIEQYRAQGLSEREAFEKVLGDQAVEMGLDFLGGALSGGVMGGAAVAGNRISGSVQNRNAGKRAEASVNSAYETLLKSGMFSDEAGQALLRANGDVRNALEQNRPADVRGLTLPGNEKAALQAADGLTAEGQRPAVQYSIQTAADGEKVTVLDTRQDIFEGKPQKDFAKIARREILEHFKGQVLPLGENDLARITGKTAGEYAYPHNQPKGTADAAKMRASTELDNLLQTAEYVNSANDTKNHPQANLGFDYYRTRFVVDGHVFEGLVNIATSERGRVLYDITKIEEVPDTSGKYATLVAQSTSAFGNLTGTILTQNRSNSKDMQKNSLHSLSEINYQAPRGMDAIEWGRRTRRAAQAGTELERSAAFYKVDPEVTKKISRLARDTGAKVVFDGTLEKGVNGYYGDGYLHINPHSENAPVVFSHELTHHLESTGTYEKLRNLVLTRLDEDGGLKELRRSKEAEYQRRGVNLDGAGVDAELVAEYVSERLFTDEAAIRRVANADLSLAGRIRSFLSRMAAKVTGQTEKAFLLKAESLYAKAIREAERNGAAAGGNRFSVENGKGLWYDGEKGGGADGAEIRDVGGRDRGEVPGAGGQGAAGDGYLRGAEENRRESGEIGKFNRSSPVRSVDSEGRGIKQEIAERLRGTAITDDAGNPVAVYHSTREKFTTFAKGDVGFHFGSLAQAESRARQKGGSEPSRMIRAYLNIQNPVYVSSDIMSFKPVGTALKLWSENYLSYQEYETVQQLGVQGQEYDSPASIKLREILKVKGYDGIAYENGYEGAGTSYIAFYPDQIIQDTDGGDGKQFSLGKEQALLRANGDVRNALEQNRPADVRGLTLPGNEKAALQAAEGGLTVEGQRPAVQYSIQTAADGEKVTVLDTRQDIFDGKSPNEFSRIARKEILEYFQGQTLPLGENDLARVTKKTAGEYAYPHNALPDKEYIAKMRGSAELGNLLQTSEYLYSAEDSKNHHQAELGFDYYKSKFIVDGHIFEGIVNVATSDQGRVLYDITKIEEVPDTSGKYATLVAQSTSAFGNLTGTILTQNRSNSKDMQKNSLHSPSEINYQAPRGVDAIEWGRRTRKAAQAGTELERSAAFYKVDPEVTKKISRLARDTGAKVVFDGTLEKGVNGYYGDGYLHINPHSGNAPVVFSHELTHHLESTGTYEKLRILVLTRLDEDGGLKELRRSKAAEYQRRGVNLDGAGVDAELVAEYVSEKLFTDEAAIRRVANADLSLAGRIRSFLSRMAAKVTGQTEKAFLLKAESLYTKAIREAERNGAAADENRFSVENGKGLWYDGEKGGGADGAEIRDVGGRDRGEVPGAGGQGAAGDGYLRGAEGSGEETQIGRGQSAHVRSTDSEGRGIKQEIAERLRGTAITDDARNPLAVYHSTRERFTTFAKGDVGFHFGSLAQAQDRARQKGGSEPSRTVRAYLNIQNPIHIVSDIMSWKPEGTALKLYTSGMISASEFNSVDALFGQGQEYDSPASIKLREILKAKGYDGIAYENGYEGAGTSYIAFYPDQIIQDSDGGDGKQYSLTESFGQKELEDGIKKAARMGSVADIKGIPFEPGKGLQEKVLRFIQSQGEIVNRQLGRVVFSSSRIRNDISHGIGPEKAASFAAVPEVIRQGEVVDYRKNWKGRGYDTAIIAAPITLNGTEFIEGVILTRSLGENRFYLHEVLTEKSDRVSRSTRGAANATVHTSGNTLSINSVLQKIIDVKNGRGSGVRYSLAKEQKAAGKKEVSKVRSNTFENAPTIFEKADLAAKEMAKSGFQYDVKTEQASMN